MTEARSGPVPPPQLPFSMPAGATQLILVRHGSSAVPLPGEPVRMTGGQADPSLSGPGRQQAVAVAHRLRNETVAVLLATPLRRTAETAAPLATAIGIGVEVIDALREVHLGEWEQEFSCRLAQGEPLLREVIRAGRWDIAPGAESMEAFGRRAATGLGIAADRAGPDACAVVFTHGGVIAEACRQVTASAPFAFLQAENASITRLARLASGRWILRSFNDTAHLEQARCPEFNGRRPAAPRAAAKGKAR